MRLPSAVLIALGVFAFVLFAAFQNSSSSWAGAPGFTGSMTLQRCSYQRTAFCAEFTSSTGTYFEIQMTLQLPAFNVSVISSGSMGIFDRPAGSLGYYYVYTAQGLHSIGDLYVLDLDAGAQVGSFTFNYPASMLYFDVVSDPLGNRYPFLAPGAGVPADSLCIFTPYLAFSNPGCGNWFRDYDVATNGVRGNDAGSLRASFA